MKKNPTIALIGRTNAGKSTLFNRLLGKKKALVAAELHTTRDRNVGSFSWGKHSLNIVDSGGLDLSHSDIFKEEIRRGATTAILHADLILFVVEGPVGIVPEDRIIAQLLRKYKKKVLVVVNKCDKPREREEFSGKFLSLGFGNPVPVSALNGSGTGDLLDVVENVLFKNSIKKESLGELPSLAIRVAIVGKPNVGKSSLLNAILGEERVIVSPIPHTTREPIDTPFIYKDTPYILVDTAGIRRRTHISDFTSRKGVEETLKILSDVHVVLFVVDAHEMMNAQDSRVVGEIQKHGASVILVVNKWDLVSEKDSSTIREYERSFRNFFPYLHWVPILFVSAVKKQRVYKMLDEAKLVWAERNKWVSDHDLEMLLTASLIKHRPPRGSTGKKIPLFGLKQTSTNPPKFDLLLGGKDRLEPSYLRYLENQIRASYGFSGTPIFVRTKYVKK